ncbi:hypothetical protein B0H12DRAFT_1112583 [Mycena haematopus]|nr:hypothetical protein B0H12DRAFT_1112583 [Mycena haematopus]
MRRRFLWSKQPAPHRTRLKPPNVLPDVLWTSVLALNESADAFPPLKSVVGGVVAIWQVAERTRHCKSDARAIALRVKDIIDVVADAVPDGSEISPPMLDSIFRFSLLLDDILRAMEGVSRASPISGFVHLNRNEGLLERFKTKLDDAYRDFLTASTLRLEIQQTQLAKQQKQLAIQQNRFAAQQAESHLQLETVHSVTTRVLFKLDS